MSASEATVVANDSPARSTNDSSFQAFIMTQGLTPEDGEPLIQNR